MAEFSDGARYASDTSAESQHGPRPAALESVFDLREVRKRGERVLYLGESLVPERMLIREVWPAFREAGYEIELAKTRGGDQDVLVARPASTGIEGVPWTNIVLLFATLSTTLFVGATAWYYIPVQELVANPLLALRAWPFVASVLGVLLTHELGHYLMGRYHGVDVSLPYLIPFAIPFGTMGAVIQIRGQMPDREALFDIGVAGPLAGLVATVVVTAIGLTLEPQTVPQSVVEQSGRAIAFGEPALLTMLATALGEPLHYADPAKTIHPVIVGGWVGMFFTLLNLLPVGQLDGGHIARALLGERQESLAALVPFGLFGIAAYLHEIRGLSINDSVGLWVVWGLFAVFIAYKGPAHPIDDRPTLGRKRVALGLLTFALGALCFMLVPVQVVQV